MQQQEHLLLPFSALFCADSLQGLAQRLPRSLPQKCLPQRERHCWFGQKCQLLLLKAQGRCH